METNTRISPALFASNLIRNLALHANSGVPWLTQQINVVVASVHRLTGKDLNDPATTFPLCRFIFPRDIEIFDSLASCPGHLILGFIAAGLLFAKCRANVRIIGFGAISVGGMLLFCLFLKWQIWHIRIHLGWFLFLAPAIAIALSERLPRWAMHLTSTGLLLFALFTLVHNSSRPVLSARFWLLPREHQYFTPRDEQEMLDGFSNAAETLIASRAQNIGLKATFCGFEYPLWIMLRNRGFQGRLERWYVENESARLSATNPAPDVIITTFLVVPESVSAAYPHVMKFAHIQTLWTKKPLTVASSTLGMEAPSP